MQNVLENDQEKLAHKEEVLRIDELAALVHPRNGHKRLFAMIEAYLDESGIHDGAKICVIAGYYGGHGQWRKFERDWRKVFLDAGMTIDQFHATDFVRKRDYAPLLKRLASVIERHKKIHPVSAGIIVEDFFTFNELQRRFLTGATLMPSGKLVSSGLPNRPYFVPFQNCVRRITTYAPVGGKAHFSFGVDSKFSKYATSLYKIIKDSPLPDPSRGQLGMLSFPAAKDTPQLQAADLLALLTYQHLRERLAEGDLSVPPKPILAACLSHSQAPDDHTFLDRATLLESLAQTYAWTGRWDGTKEIYGFEREDEDELPS